MYWLHLLQRGKTLPNVCSNKNSECTDCILWPKNSECTDCILCRAVRPIKTVALSEELRIYWLHPLQSSETLPNVCSDRRIQNVLIASSAVRWDPSKRWLWPKNSECTDCNLCRAVDPSKYWLWQKNSECTDCILCRAVRPFQTVALSEELEYTDCILCRAMRPFQKWVSFVGH